MQKSLSKQKLSLLLSLYIDNKLPDTDRTYLEELLEHDADARKEYSSLRDMKQLLNDTPRLQENPFLVEKIISRATAKDDSQEFWILPKRFVPAAAMIAVTLIVFTATFTMLKYEDISEYLSQKTSAVQQTYEDNILNGWIMPLFERTDKDQVLNYAMFGVLPLDADEGTMLRIDESSEQGYQVELASGDTATSPSATLADLYQEIQPTASQKKVFDTLFLYAQKHIEEAVLINEQEELAIDPSIASFHKVILAGIAANLEPRQLERFERFMEEHETTYALASHNPAPPSPPQVIYERLQPAHENNEFVVLTANEVNLQAMELNMDSLREMMIQARRQNRHLEYQIHSLARQLSAPRPRMPRIPSQEGIPAPEQVSAADHPPAAPTLTTHPVVLRNKDGSITISISRNIEAVEKNFRRASDTFFRHVVVMRHRQFERSVQKYKAARRTGLDREGRSAINMTVQRDSAEEILIEMNEDFEKDLEMDILKRLEIYIPPQSEAEPGRHLFQWHEYMPVEARRMLDSLREIEQYDFELQERDERRIQELLLKQQAKDSTAVR